MVQHIHTYPTLSVIIATYNSRKTIVRCLASLKKQIYPPQKVQILVIDGGSSDTTLAIAKSYGCEIHKVKKLKQNAEYNKGYGLRFVRGEFVLFIDHDNILPHHLWLKNMIVPFFKDKEIVATEPLRYHFDRSYPVLDRYFALFGVTDPAAFYLGKADKASYLSNAYNLLGKSVDRGKYYEVRFDRMHPERIPTLGANGFLIKKKFLQPYIEDPKKYFHIDINVDIIKTGNEKYAFIKDDIGHVTLNSFREFLKRKQQFMNDYFIKQHAHRRYSVYLPTDRFKLFLFIFYSLTIIKPLFDATRGWVRVKDIAWFLHPFMCLSMVIVYGTTMVKYSFNNFQMRLK